MSDPLLTWTAHPARSRPRDVALVVAIVCTTAGVVLWTFESAWLALLAAVFLLLSVSSFLLPTRYRVTDEGIEAARALVVRRRRFADLRRLEVGADAALVSPLSRPSFLDRQRGLWIWLDGADRDRLLGLLRDKIPSERAKQTPSERAPARPEATLERGAAERPGAPSRSERAKQK